MRRAMGLGFVEPAVIAGLCNLRQADIAPQMVAEVRDRVWWSSFAFPKGAQDRDQRLSAAKSGDKI